MGFNHVLYYVLYFGILQLLVICSTICSSSAHQSCNCPNQDQGKKRHNSYSRSVSLDRIYYPIIMYSGTFWSSLYSLRHSSIDYFEFYGIKGASMDDVGLLYAGELESASFSASFTVSLYRPQNQKTEGLVFVILPLPYVFFMQNNALGIPLVHDKGSLVLSNTSSKTWDVSGSSVLVEIGEAKMAKFSIVGVNITIKPDPEVNPTPNYTVWIDFDADGRRILVYIDDAENPKPESSALDKNVSFTISNTTKDASVGLFSSVGQLSEIQGLNMTYEAYFIVDQGSTRLAIKLSSVLGPVAATAIMASAVVWYFNSKYMRWKKDLDRLAKSMQRLPGVPMQVNFGDIKKATANFHETMMLGKGGFGSVYRCTLPASEEGQILEVAVKKFSRDDNRQYDDFLAEVSIINRLRHKNIVPLVGWSYNKGETLLVYEYMTNGSLDQHLFPRGATVQQRRRVAAFRQWSTRYYIVMDIATGLHYVHHEYEPMVLHRDIKASNVMLDSTFRARLGDFGLACTVAFNQNSVSGIAGTWGYIAPEYALNRKATRQTDIYAFGVLILEIVTGKSALLKDVSFDLLIDWVWHLHHKGQLLEAVDSVLVAGHGEFDADEAERLLLLGLACSNPNPSDRPSMLEALQVITKSAPLPEVPLEKPRFVWCPLIMGPSSSSSSDYNTAASKLDNRGSSALPSISELVENPTSLRFSSGGHRLNSYYSL